MHYNFKFYLTYNNDNHNNQKKKKKQFFYFIYPLLTTYAISHSFILHTYLYIFRERERERASSKVFYKDI